MHIPLLLSLHLPSVASADGRLYRCDVTPALSNGTLAATAEDTTTNASDDEGWEEKEASRTHSVKFTDPQDQDSREVSSTTSSTSSTLTKCVCWVHLLDCVSRTLQRSESYYVLSSIGKENDEL